MNQQVDVIKKEIRSTGHFIYGKACSLLLLFLLLTVTLQAQSTYPVQVYTQLMPPYTPHVPSYYSGSQQKLKVTLVNTDMKHPLLNVYLRMKIQSSSFSMITPPEVYTPSIELQAGVPLTLSLDDLAVYFKRENVRVSGGQGEFNRTQLLPDNFYRFHFDVFEVNTNRLLSNSRIGFAQAMIASGEPPVLAQPKKGAAIIQSNIPSIFFSWTPRHMNSVAAAYGTEYEITLVEIHDKQTSPENAFQYSRVLYTETTRSTSFIHTPAQPMLMPGMRYAWRVRAVAKQGIDDANIFKNNGYSEVWWFDYIADCPAVQSFGAVYDNGKMNVTWVDTEAIEYIVEYRKKGSQKWYKGTILNKACPLYNLQYGQEYEYRIGSRCVANDVFNYSKIQAFRMPDREEKGPNCGLMPNINITNQTPVVELPPALPVMVGDFPVFISEVSGSGRFSGTGYVGIPYLSNAKVAVVFKDIVVNTDNQLISGYFETKYDEKNNMIFDVDKTLTGGKGVGDVRSGEERAAFVVDYTINPDIKAIPLKSDGTKDEITDSSGNYNLKKGENGKYTFVLVDSEGKERVVESGTVPFTIMEKGKDGQPGNTYTVNEKGEISLASSPTDIRLDEKTKDKERKDIAEITFHEIAGETKYALDQYREIYKKVTEYNLKYQENHTKIPVSAKLVVEGGSDCLFVKAKPGKGFDPAKVHFISDKGKKYNAEYKESEGGWKLTVTASEANDGQNLYVVHEETDKKGTKTYATLARLGIYTYAVKEINVKLVSVNDFTIGEVSDKVKQIFSKFGVNVTISATDKFDYPPVKGQGLKVMGSGLFSTLTDDMKQIEKAYQMHLGDSYDGNTYYLFMIEKADGGMEVETPYGDMPRGKQFGYLFAKADAATVAHELGHGAFHLDHPFKRANASTSFPKNELTDNLMHYHNGTNLAKLQWDAMHAPGLVIGLFERDKDAMIVLKNTEKLGFTPKGHIVSKYPPKYKNPFRTNGTLFIQEFDSDNGTYKWVDDAYYLNGDKLSDRFVAWEVDSNGKEKSITADLKVAIWKDSKYPDCYALYQWIDVKKGYTSVNYSTLESQINTPDSSKWEPDWVHEADKEKCQKLFDKEKTELTGKGSGNRAKIQDYTKRVSAEKVKKSLSVLKAEEEVSKQKYEIYITDDKTKKEEFEAVKLRYEQGDKDNHIIWIHFDAKDQADVKINYAGIIQNDFLYACAQYIARALNMENIPPISLSSILDGLSYIVGQLVIPEKYYDPDNSEYNSIIADVYRHSIGIATGGSAKDYLGLTVLDPKYGSVEIEVAFACGVWNGAVHTLKGIPDLGSLFVKILTNEDGTRDQIRNITWDSVKQMFSDEWNSVKSGSPCIQAHFAGRVVLEIAAFYFAWTKAGKIGSVVNVVDKLNVISVMFRATGWTLKYTGRTIRIAGESGWKFFQVMAKGTRGSLYMGFPIPLDGTISKASKAAYEKARTLIQGYKEADIDRLTYVLAEDGSRLVDEEGNMLVKILVDGEEVMVVVNSNKDKILGLSDNIVHNLDDYLAKIQSVIGEKQAKQLAKEFANNIEIISKIADDEALLKAWSKLNDGGRKLVRTNIHNLESFAKLSDEVQETLLKFTDETLAKFMDDIAANPALINFVNNPQYLMLLRGFVAHKLKDAEIHDIGGFLADEGLESLGKAEREFAEKWLQRSKKYASFKGYTELGKKLSDNIINSLEGKTKMFKDLAEKLGISADELAKYQIFREVPLNTPGGFMKADALLVKKNARGVIEDVILIENKLSKGTAYTERQLEGLSKIAKGEKMEVRYLVEVVTVDNKSFLKPLESMKIEMNKCFRFDDHGTKDINKVDIELINFSNYK